MTGISLNLPEDLPNSLADLAKSNGQTATYLAMDVLRDYIEHEKNPDRSDRVGSERSRPRQICHRRPSGSHAC